MAVCHFFIIIDKCTGQSTGHSLYIDKHVPYITELWDYTRDSHHTTTTTLKMTQYTSDEYSPHAMDSSTPHTE